MELIRMEGGTWAFEMARPPTPQPSGTERPRAVVRLFVAQGYQRVDAGSLASGKQTSCKADDHNDRNNHGQGHRIGGRNTPNLVGHETREAKTREQSNQDTSHRQ